MELELFS